MIIKVLYVFTYDSRNCLCPEKTLSLQIQATMSSVPISVWKEQLHYQIQILTVLGCRVKTVYRTLFISLECVLFLN